MKNEVNITAIARGFHATTPNIRKRLDRLGVNPIQEIEMPSGRKFVLYDRAQAFSVLEQEQRAREQAASVAPEPEQTFTADTASTVDYKVIKQDIDDIKSLLEQILEAVTAPVHKEGE